MQLHKERVQEMKRKHTASRIELRTRQMESMYEMKTDHLNKQHCLEWDSQIAYSNKAKKELKRKHAQEQKQQPKELKVQQNRGKNRVTRWLQQIFLHNYVLAAAIMHVLKLLKLKNYQP